MSFLNTIWDWINNTIIKTTYDPAADALKQVYRQNISQYLGVLQSTVGSIGSGLGNAILSIPGVGEPVRNALSDLQKESEKILAQASSMTPDQIAVENDKIQQNLRREYFEERYTTSHWPYPLTSVPLQPYYNQGTRITIDYASLSKPKLDDLKEEIEKLL